MTTHPLDGQAHAARDRYRLITNWIDDVQATTILHPIVTDPILAALEAAKTQVLTSAGIALIDHAANLADQEHH